MAKLTQEEIAALREQHRKPPKCEIYRDSMQNFKKYGIPHAQLIIADIPYNVGTNFYGSNPMWYNGGDNKNGESKLAGKAAFNSDFSFNLYEYFNFAKQMMKPEPTEKVTRRGGAERRSVYDSFLRFTTDSDAHRRRCETRIREIHTRFFRQKLLSAGA